MSTFLHVYTEQQIVQGWKLALTNNTQKTFSTQSQADICTLVSHTADRYENACHQ